MFQLLDSVAIVAQVAQIRHDEATGPASDSSFSPYAIEMGGHFYNPFAENWGHG